MCLHNVVSLFAAQEGPLSSLAATELMAHYHSWSGASGRRYVASVFPVDATSALVDLPDFDSCLLLAVARKGSGRGLLRIFQIERESDRRAARASFGAGVVDEWHVHLLASDRRARLAAATDLRARHEHSASAVRA